MSSLSEVEFTKSQNPGFYNDFSNLGLVCGFFPKILDFFLLFSKILDFHQHFTCF
jgi:hypothetical protein